MMCGAATAQTAAGGSISVNADEVLVDLLVHDGKGRPVLDLTPQQLTVTDDGSEVQLKNLRLVQDDPERGHEVTLVFGKLDAADDKSARTVARKILDALPKGFLYSVMNVGARLRLLQMFTTDRAQIDKGIELATLQESQGELAQTSAAAEKNLISVAQTGADVSGQTVTAKDRAMAKVVLASLEESQQIVQEQNSQATLAGLLALARNERDLSGRRAIIFFTEGLQMDVNTADMIRSVVGAANRAGVTIYAVDLSPLNEQATSNMIAAAVMATQVGPARVAASAPAVRGVVSAPRGMLHQIAEQTQRIETEDMQGADDPLAGMSTETGGAYLAANSSLKRPLKQMLEDMTTYYEASFVPSISDYNGSFRPVKVTSMRKGLVLRYRAGYFAIAPDAVSKVRPFEEPLLKTLAGATLPEDVRFHVGLFRMGTLQDGDTNTLVIETPLKELDVREDSNTKLYSLHLTMVVQVRNKEGVVIHHFSQDLPQHGAISSLRWAEAQTVTMQRHFIAPPGEYVLEAAVVDRNSGKVGAQKIHFVVPAHAPGLGLSDMVLVRRMDMLRPDGDPMEPLRYGKAKVIANASGEADIEAKNISVFFMIHPGTARAPVKLEMEVAKDGRVVGKIPLPVRSDAGEGTVIPYLASIQTRWLSAGHYEIAAMVTQGESSEKQTVDFTLLGPGGEVAGSTAGASAEPAAESALPHIGEAAASKLVITALENPLPAPTPEESAALVSQARGWALHYAESLPNFLCVEVTTRSVDPRGTGDWKPKDEMAQLLKYRDNNESRTMLEANGKRSKEVPDVFRQVSTRGQFGGVLNAVFEPSAQAEFHWKETARLGMGKAQVFSYEVKAEDSSYGLTGSDNSQMNVAFHGLVYIDAATMGVRRITMEAEGIPRNFSIQASAMAVDYDYIVINRHDYLMPIHAAVTVRQGKHEDVLNEIEFRDYKRFGSRVKILDYAQVPAQ